MYIYIYINIVVHMLVLHQVVNKINKKGTIYFKSSQIFAYADDSHCYQEYVNS
jgi:hypothetical protein